MNAIGGYVKSTGAVELLGTNVSSLSPSGRARHGLGRTFQAATLFPELTVRETVGLALEGRHRTGLLSAALVPAAFGAHGTATPGGERRPHRLPRARPLRRRVHLRPLHRHPPGGRAGRTARARRAGALPRRAHRGSRATRDRGVRARHRRHPPGARRVGARDRARHAAHHGHQRPRLLPRAGQDHRPRRSRSGPPRPGGHRRPTSAPTNGRSPAAAPRPNTTNWREPAVTTAHSCGSEEKQGWHVVPPTHAGSTCLALRRSRGGCRATRRAGRPAARRRGSGCRSRARAGRPSAPRR